MGGFYMGSLDKFKEQMKEAYEEGKNKGKQAGSFSYQIQKKQENAEKLKLEKQQEEEKIAQLKKEHIPFCPKCHSTSVTYVNKKLSIGRAVVGGTLGIINPLAGVAGATLGGLSSNKGKIKCLNCGHTWKI
jgi:Zn finger protein HypA/HybF involved in hydrogenase expression